MMKRVSALISAAFAGSLMAGTTQAQVPPNGGQPAPGTGNSTAISSANRETQSNYNQLIGAADPKAAKVEQKGKTASAAKPATAADITAGAALRGLDGVPVGTVSSLNGDQVVVDTGQTKIGVPLIAFGKDEKGLLLSITAAKFNEAVAKAKAH
jgi:hypothetical protein